VLFIFWRFEFIAEGSKSEVMVKNENKWSELKTDIMETKEELQELEEKVSIGLKEAYRKMVIFKKQKNSPMIVSRNGKVIEIQPENIPPTTNAKNEYAN